MPFKDITITAMDGCKLAGWYIPAKDPSSKKLAVVSHCTTLYMNKSGCEYHRPLMWACVPVPLTAVDHVLLQKRLYEAGYHVLTWDMRNHGHSEKKLPSGWGEIEYMDHVGAMDWVSQQPALKSCKIVYLPLCVGGTSFLKANSVHPN
eukprot:3911904-Prymnesium_polylepis.1